LIGPFALQLPSGLLLYWTSSMLMAYGQNAVLERIMPYKKAIEPCKPRKPLRIGRSMRDKMS